VALHYLDGFAERFGRAAAAVDTLFTALRQHGLCEIGRSAAATNVTRLRVRGCGAPKLSERLLAHGIAIRAALETSADGAEFELVTNETILRRPVADTIEAFVNALGSV
jgi:threonine aldolase